MADTFPMTPSGVKKLRDELADLKENQRPKIITAIGEARALGDLKENAEYHAAREKQGFIEGRIQEIEYKLANCQIIDISKMKDTGRVIFGTTVELEDLDSGETMTYQIVGEDEANINEGRISNISPIARALMGKEAGDVAEVVVPNGKRSLEIIEVHYS